MRHPEPRGLVLKQPFVLSDHFDEPELAFGGSGRHLNPKVGIPLYGPHSYGTVRHKVEVHVGFVGTSESVSRAMEFYRDCADGVDGDGAHEPFPGFMTDRGFRSALRTDEQLVELISRQEERDLLALSAERERFEQMLALLSAKLQLLRDKDYPLDYVAVALPTDLYQRCRVTDYVDERGRRVHRDLRLALKSVAMGLRLPTQIIRESTYGRSPKQSKGKGADHPAKIAWNLFTGLYFKADCLPWAPTHLPPAS